MKTRLKKLNFDFPESHTKAWKQEMHKALTRESNTVFKLTPEAWRLLLPKTRAYLKSNEKIHVEVKH